MIKKIFIYLFLLSITSPSFTNGELNQPDLTSRPTTTETSWHPKKLIEKVRMAVKKAHASIKAKLADFRASKSELTMPNTESNTTAELTRTQQHEANLKAKSEVFFFKDTQLKKAINTVINDKNIKLIDKINLIGPHLKRFSIKDQKKILDDWEKKNKDIFNDIPIETLQEKFKSLVEYPTSNIVRSAEMTKALSTTISTIKNPKLLKKETQKFLKNVNTDDLPHDKLALAYKSGNTYKIIVVDLPDNVLKNRLASQDNEEPISINNLDLIQLAADVKKNQKLNIPTPNIVNALKIKFHITFDQISSTPPIESKSEFQDLISKGIHETESYLKDLAIEKFNTTKPTKKELQKFITDYEEFIPDDYFLFADANSDSLKFKIANLNTFKYNLNETPKENAERLIKEQSLGDPNDSNLVSLISNTLSASITNKAKAIAQEQDEENIKKLANIYTEDLNQENDDKLKNAINAYHKKYPGSILDL